MTSNTKKRCISTHYGLNNRCYRKKKKTYLNIPIRIERKEILQNVSTCLEKKCNYLQQNTNIIYGRKQTCLNFSNWSIFRGKTSAHAPTIWSRIKKKSNYGIQNNKCAFPLNMDSNLKLATFENSKLLKN